MRTFARVFAFILWGLTFPAGSASWAADPPPADNPVERLRLTIVQDIDAMRAFLHRQREAGKNDVSRSVLESQEKYLTRDRNTISAYLQIDVQNAQDVDAYLDRKLQDAAAAAREVRRVRLGAASQRRKHPDAFAFRVHESVIERTVAGHVAELRKSLKAQASRSEQQRAANRAAAASAKTAEPVVPEPSENAPPREVFRAWERQSEALFAACERAIGDGTVPPTKLALARDALAYDKKGYAKARAVFLDPAKALPEIPRALIPRSAAWEVKANARYPAHLEEHFRDQHWIVGKFVTVTSERLVQALKEVHGFKPPLMPADPMADLEAKLPELIARYRKATDEDRLPEDKELRLNPGARRLEEALPLLRPTVSDPDEHFTWTPRFEPKSEAGRTVVLAAHYAWEIQKALLERGLMDELLVQELSDALEEQIERNHDAKHGARQGTDRPTAAPEAEAGRAKDCPGGTPR